MDDDIQLIASSITLPNGAKICNRLAKVSLYPVLAVIHYLLQAAMEEGMGNGGGLPSRSHRRLYKRWGQGGWGIIITGHYVFLLFERD